MRQPKLYIASKTNHAKSWLELRKKWPEVHFVMRWPWQVVADGHDGTVEAPDYASHFWQNDLADVREADYVLVYAEGQFSAIENAEVYEKLRGALVEAGMALALGKQVILVGNAPDYGTWQHHPNVIKVKTLDDARKCLAPIKS